jgi:hypothetical protein
VMDIHGGRIQKNENRTIKNRMEELFDLDT